MDSSCPTENRQHRTDAARTVPESSEEDRDSTACTGKDGIRSWKRPLKSKILSIKPPELGTSTVSSTRFGRDDPPRSSKQWRRKPSKSNVRGACRVRRPAEQNHFDATESDKIATVLNSIHQLKIPAHMLNRRSAHKRSTETAKTKEAKNFIKSEAQLVDVMDTLQRVISVIEKEMANNLTFLQKVIGTRNKNNVMAALIMIKTSMSIAFSKLC